MPYRPIYYDTETTGVKADKDSIIEIAAFDPVMNKTFEYLINPQKPIPPESTRIHNITDEMVKEAPLFGEVAELFIEFCRGDTVLVAHNNDGFDKHFLANEFKRAKVELPNWRYLDTLKWARRYRPDLPRHTLQHLREIYGITANNAHRALDDVIILHQVFSKMIDDLPFDTVLELMDESPAMQHMPFGKHRGKPLKDVPKSYIKWLSESGALAKPDNKELKDRFQQLNLL